MEKVTDGGNRAEEHTERAGVLSVLGYVGGDRKPTAERRLGDWPAPLLPTGCFAWEKLPVSYALGVCDSVNETRAFLLLLVQLTY